MQLLSLSRAREERQATGFRPSGRAEAVCCHRHVLFRNDPDLQAEVTPAGNLRGSLAPLSGLGLRTYH